MKTVKPVKRHEVKKPGHEERKREMSRMTTEAVVNLPRPEAKKYFDDWAADLSSRLQILDLAEEIYVGPGNTVSNEAVAILMHACAYLEDRVGYEMEPHPKGMIRMPQ